MISSYAHAGHAGCRRGGGCECRCEVLPVGMILRRSSLKIPGDIVGFRAGEAAAEGAFSLGSLTVVYTSYSTSTPFANLGECNRLPS